MRPNRSRSVPPSRARLPNSSAQVKGLSQGDTYGLGQLFLAMVNADYPPASGPAAKKPKCNRVTEVQRHRVTESLSYGVTEVQSIRDTDVTDGTDVSAPASRVATLPEAAKISLEHGLRHDSLFTFARALKAFEITTGCKPDLEGALAVWWPLAKPHLPSDADFGEYLWALRDAFLSANSPLGANVLLQALHLAPSLSYKPTSAEREVRIKWVCCYLQKAAGESPFFISVRDVAKVIQTDNLRLAQSLIRSLVFERFMEVAERGSPKGRKATRFRIV